MKMNVAFNDFRKMFEAYDRADNFPEGLRCLFDYLLELEESTGIRRYCFML